MKKTMWVRYCVFFFCVLILIGCATTKLTMVWKDQSFHGTIKKVVVVGTFKKPSTRNFFEDEFVRQLKARGVDAIASYTLLPIDKLSSKDVLIDKIKATGADAALVTRMVDKKTVQTYVPGEVYVVPDYYYYWGPYFNYVYTPGYMVSEEYAFAETNIYNTGNGKLVWSAGSRTLLSGDNQNLITSFVSTMVDRLAADKLI